MQVARQSRIAGWRSFITFIGLGGLVALAGLAVAAEPPAARTPGTVTIQGNPDGLDEYVVVDAFPNLQFERPVWIGSPPDGSNYLWVLEQGGQGYVFENDRSVKKATKALDLSKQVYREHNEEGLQGLAFHPDFKKNRELFLSYSAGDPRRLVVARFQTSSTRRRVMPNSEELVLRQRQPYGNHNGGGLAFGPDGMLYVAFGDGGSHGDPENNAQNLRNWLGSILRLDVNVKRGGFQVPTDNPFVEVQHVRPEIWAFGLQNPRRFSFDRVTGALWAGDVGNDKFQEVNLIEKGGNYGWSYREGTEVFKQGKARDILTDPILTAGGDTARRITGGFVYRGKRMPALIGAYVYGDIATGNVWALRHDGKRVTENRLIGRGRGVTSFGEDQDGEIYFTCFDGHIYTLAPWASQDPSKIFPRRLSDTGLYLDTRGLKPHPALIPYQVNVPLWSDGASKDRWFMLPGTSKIQVRKDGTFEFPVGTIFLKHFYLGAEERGPMPGTRLETRLFLRRPRAWEGYTYVWDDKQEDAHLLDGRLKQPRGVGAKEMWTFPSRSDCMSCHTETSNRVLGFRTEQLDRLVSFGGEQVNQLDVLERLDVFEKKVARGKAWPSWENPGKNMEEAVRAYLDVNCAMCHMPDGPGNASIDLRYTTDIRKAGLVDRRPGQWDLDIYDARLLVPGEPKRSTLYMRMLRTDEKGMPPLSHNVVDPVGTKRIEDWIASMKGR